MQHWEYIVEVEQQLRETVLYPEAEMRERYARELERGRRRSARPRRWSPNRLLGCGLIQAGNTLTRLGERLASIPTHNRAPQSPA